MSTELASLTQTDDGNKVVGSDVLIFNTSSPAGTNCSARLYMGSETCTRWLPDGLDGFILMTGSRVLTDIGLPDGEGWDRLSKPVCVCVRSPLFLRARGLMGS